MASFATPHHPKYTFPFSSYAGSEVAEPRTPSGVSTITLFGDFGDSIFHDFGDPPGFVRWSGEEKSNDRNRNAVKRIARQT